MLMTRKLILILTLVVSTSLFVVGCSGGSGDSGTDANVPVETGKGGMKPTGVGGAAGANNGPAFGKPQPN